MTKVEMIFAPGAPQAIGPYSVAVRAGSFVFCAGQIGVHPETGKLRGGILAQTRRALSNLKAVLKAAGLKPNNVVKATVFLKNMEDFSGMNEVYAKFFGQHKPARATVEVAALPRGALVEIEVIAVVR